LKDFDINNNDVNFENFSVDLNHFGNGGEQSGNNGVRENNKNDDYWAKNEPNIVFDSNHPNG